MIQSITEFQSIFRRFSCQVFNKINEFVWYIFRIDDIFPNNFLVHDFSIIFTERSIPAKEFVGQYAKTPVVNFVVKWFEFDDLRTEIFRSATKCSSWWRAWFNGPTEIAKFKLVIDWNQNIFWFYVSVDYVHRLEVMNCTYHLSHVSFDPRFVKSFYFS